MGVAVASIHFLSEQVFHKIAAGEVIERPLSAVKELVENAVDAGADAISVTLRAGGKELIRVEDNGSGFAAADIEIAFQRHTTSKLTELEDRTICRPWVSAAKLCRPSWKWPIST
jgi:DNA mismatch repair protein MutL